MIQGQENSTSGPAASATRVRWLMLGLVTLIMIIDSMDRANLGIAGKGIMEEFHLSTQDMGWILSAFTLSYALFQLPWGYAGDKYGARRILTLAVIWSSVATAATAIAPRLHFPGISVLGSFFFVRFMVGVGVAAAAPNLSKIVARWMSKTERGVGVSFLSIGTGIAGALSPIAIAWLMEVWGWRLPFYLGGAIGIASVVAWVLYSTDAPQTHPKVNSEELALILKGREHEKNYRPGAHPWRKILSSRSVWMLVLSAACQGYAAYIFYNWFFLYLVRVRGLTVRQGGWWGATPFIATIVFSPLGGWISDRAVQRFGIRRGRQLGAWIGMGFSALFIWMGGHSSNTTAAILMLAIGAGFNFFGWASYWAACIDLAPNYSGSLTGLMNSCANFGGWLSPIITARVAVKIGWTRAIDVAAVITLIAGFLWIFQDSSERIEIASEPATPVSVPALDRG